MTALLLVAALSCSCSTLAAAAAASAGPAGAADSDGPFGLETDCAVRGLLLEHARHIQPQLSGANLRHVFDRRVTSLPLVIPHAPL